MQKPFIVIDFETTGVNSREDRIVEIGMVKVLEEGPAESKRTYVNPEIPIPIGATECHNITDEMVKDAPTFRRLAKSLLEFIDGYDIVGYNSISFDIPLLYSEFHRAGLKWDYSKVHFIDACNIFKRKEERTLSAAVKFYTGQEFPDAHSAIVDCSGTLEVLYAQLKLYPDITDKTNAELALYSNYDKPFFDIAGCFTKDEVGRWIFNFGKYKGEDPKDHKHYLKWMLEPKNSFLPDTLDIVKQIL